MIDRDAPQAYSAIHRVRVISVKYHKYTCLTLVAQVAIFTPCKLANPLTPKTPIYLLLL